MTEPVDTPTAAAGAAPGLDVRLENFEGPLDLLLFLIKKNDLEIKDIPIAQITQEYLSYLDLIKDLNLEMAGEFLVMASTLMQIKAQMLLPAPETAEDEGPDPRTALINKLLEYQKFKEASTILSGFQERTKDVYYRQAPPVFGEEDFTLRASVFDLLSAFKKILEQAPKEMGQVLREEVPIEVKIREIMDRLVERESLSFHELFPAGRRRIELIVTFLALLELIRLNQAVARQSEIFGEIHIFRASKEENIVDPPPVAAGDDALKATAASDETKAMAASDEAKATAASDEAKAMAASDEARAMAASDETKATAASDEVKAMAASDEMKATDSNGMQTDISSSPSFPTATGGESIVVDASISVQDPPLEAAGDDGVKKELSHGNE